MRESAKTLIKRSGEWYIKNLINFSTAFFRCKFYIKPESICRHLSIRLITYENARREGDAMPYIGNFDFFYGKESERYNFIIIPKLLMKDERFQHISAEAKLMYGLFLDRNSLSQKNGWLDEENRVYIIYTIEEMKKDLGCATEKVNKVLKELESIGLIYRKRNGKRKANYIYVMDYMAIYRTAGKEERGTDGKDMNFDNRKSCISKNENHSEFRKSKRSKTDSNNTDYSNASNRKKYRNSFCSFPQREYDFEELERILLSNNAENGSL